MRLSRFRALFFLPLACLLAHACSAQHYDAHWIFGNYAGINFSTSPPTKITTSAMSTPEGCASISDPTTGQLLFYTNGVNIWNRNNVIMPNGDSLGGHVSTTQGALAVPDPANANRYYLFTIYAQAGASPDSGYCCGSGGLNYSIVDMTLDGGLGDVTVKNQLLLTPTTEKLCAVKRCGNSGYWVLTHKWNSKKFYAYPVSASGIGAPVISDTGMMHTDVGSGKAWETIGQMRVSPDGTKLALAASEQLNTVQAFAFDNATGKVGAMIFSDANYQNLCGFTGPYGVCFSPDNSKLYVSVNVGGCAATNVDTGRVVQYDLNAGTAAAIVASRVSLRKSFSDHFGALQLGPDSRMYIAKVGATALDVIQNPDGAGAACGYTPSAFNLNTFSGDHSSEYGLPNYVETWLNPHRKFRLSFSGCLQTDTVAFLDTVLVPPYSVQWNFGDPTSGSNTSTQDNPFHAFTSFGIFNVTLTVYSQCDTFVVTKPVNTLGSLAVNAGPDTTLCTGNAYTVPTIGGANYVWSPAAGLSCTTCQQPIATPIQTTTYIVDVSSPLPGCVASDTLVINVVTITPLVAGPDTSVCPGALVQLQASGATTYHWLPTQGLSNDSIANPTITVDSNIAYTVIAAYGNCLPDTQQVTLSVLPLPTVDAGTGGSIYEGESVQLNATTDAAQYSWTPPDGLSSATSLQTTASPTVSTTYTLTVTNTSGCSASDTVSVTVKEEDAYIIVPNAFSPNGDGKNDQLSYYTRNVLSVDFRIYDRWGILIFQTGSLENYWDGTFHHVPQPVGVYAYEAVGKTRSGKTVKAKGSVTLIR